MAASSYQQKPPLVTADQFQQSKPPWPAGVDSCSLGPYPGVPHLHISEYGGSPVTMPIHDTEWVIVDASGGKSILSDVTFKAQYAPAPPA